MNLNNIFFINNYKLMSLIYNDNVNNLTPKLSVYQVINKLMIAWDINNKERIPVYYLWDLDNRYPKEYPFILVDYERGTWYITYVYSDNYQRRGTIDDITGSISISNE